MATRRNAQARADSERGDGGNVVSLLRVQTSVAPTAWVRGYDTPTHCTLLGGETYRNVQFTIALYSDHRPRTCAPEQRWIACALRLLWGQADAYGQTATMTSPAQTRYPPLVGRRLPVILDAPDDLVSHGQRHCEMPVVLLTQDIHTQDRRVRC